MKSEKDDCIVLPWNDRARELARSEGAGAGQKAWMEWFSEREGGVGTRLLSAMFPDDINLLYLAFVDACVLTESRDEVPDVPYFVSCDPSPQ